MNIPKSDDMQAQFWQGPVSRAEVQKVFDEYSQTLIDLKTQLMNLDFAAAAIAEKVGITPADIKDYMTRKLAEFTANPDNYPPRETSKVSLN